MLLQVDITYWLPLPEGYEPVGVRKPKPGDMVCYRPQFGLKTSEAIAYEDLDEFARNFNCLILQRIPKTQFKWLEKQHKKYGRFFIVRVKGGPKTILKEKQCYNNRFERYLIERYENYEGKIEYRATNFGQECNYEAGVVPFNLEEDQFKSLHGLQGLSDETHEAIGWAY